MLHNAYSIGISIIDAALPLSDVLLPLHSFVNQCVCDSPNPLDRNFHHIAILQPFWMCHPECNSLGSACKDDGPFLERSALTAEADNLLDTE